MSDENEEEDSDNFYRMARTMVTFCRRHDMQPSNTIACLCTAIAIAVIESDNEWTKEGLQAIDDVVKMMIATQPPKQPQ